LAQLELALDDSLPSLTEYTVKVSKRARNVSFQVLPLTGLVVTVPLRFPKHEIPQLIRDNSAWIEKQITHVRNTTEPEFLQWPPRQFRLAAQDRTIDINYLRHSHNQTLRASLTADSLTIEGSLTDRKALLRLFASVLKSEARDYLEPQITKLASEHGLSFKRLSIRGQRTLWGSYSSTGTLCLNYKLLFIPHEYCNYVLLHELAHTRYLDHSSAFWTYLQSLCPDARRLDRELNDVAERVPPWL